MCRIKSRHALAAGLATAAAAAAAPAAHAQPIVEALDSEVRVRVENPAEPRIVVEAATSEQTATRLRIRLNRSPAVAGGCTVVTLSPVVVDCPRPT